MMHLTSLLQQKVTHYIYITHKEHCKQVVSWVNGTCDPCVKIVGVSLVDAIFCFFLPFYFLLIIFNPLLFCLCTLLKCAKNSHSPYTLCSQNLGNILLEVGSSLSLFPFFLGRPRALLIIGGWIGSPWAIGQSLGPLESRTLYEYVANKLVFLFTIYNIIKVHNILHNLV